MLRYCIIVLYLALVSCSANSQPIITGAERFDKYIPLTVNKRIAIAGNHTSRVADTHLVDTLMSRGVNIVKIFSPEHGFRGEAGAGELVHGSADPRTGIPIVSLYGSKRKPSADDMADIDLVIFDMQDVGVRFYTYISTLHYIMEACAENGIPLLVFDRPNPNGSYIDGPILETEYRSFIGMHPVPLVHGMTIGEYAQMINGEGWLGNGLVCDLQVISCLNYSRDMEYRLPFPPSPNLRSSQAVKLYPSVALFEGTVISEGRGTDFPFEVYGHPDLGYGDYYFTPVSVPAARTPKLMGMKCRGEDLRTWKPSSGNKERIELDWLLKAYQSFPDRDQFFTDFFFLLCGTKQVYNDIRAGKSEEEIRGRWVEGLKDFVEMRKQYLLYN